VTAAGLPVGTQKSRTVEAMFNRIAPRYELVNALMTFGLDSHWRRRAVGELALPWNSRVLDLACGTGDLCRELSRAGYRAVGIDVAAEMLAHARTPAPLFRADALALPFRDASVDGVVSGFALRNVLDIGTLFDEAARVVRSGGRVSFLEVAVPRPALLQRAHSLYFRRIVPLIGAALSDAAAYRYLPASTAYLPEPLALLRMLRAAGFDEVRRVALAGGAAQILLGTRA
jgi:demethylmenaquinone methyltransferase/2-methoxy-6-polyprenyl-1,4-benzoquinol methylase